VDYVVYSYYHHDCGLVCEVYACCHRDLVLVVLHVACDVVHYDVVLDESGLLE
jgi:hypothetical protein